MKGGITISRVQKFENIQIPIAKHQQIFKVKHSDEMSSCLLNMA